MTTVPLQLDMTAMKFPCVVSALPQGRWSARHDGALGPVEVTAPSREAALEKLRAELRYRAELCPCTGVGEDYVELVVTE
jgi:hypothetical protein